jgi:hypothetical protein
MHHSIRSSIFGCLAACAVVASACAGNGVSDPGPGKRVQATLPKENYVSGEIVVNVRNLSDLQLTYPYGFCKTELQRAQGPDWITVLVPDGCALAIGYLKAGQTVPTEFRLPADLAAGVYRLIMPMPVPSGATSPDTPLASPAFTVNSTALSQ